jgi:transposase
MTVERYLEVIKNYFIPFYRRMRKKYGPGVVMQEDNAPWHTATIVRNYLRRQKIKTLHWPPQSLDLSLIENLWRQIKLKIGKMRHKIKTVTQMEEALAEIWPQIEGETLLKLNRSMKRRLRMVLKNKGGPTKY